MLARKSAQVGLESRFALLSDGVRRSKRGQSLGESEPVGPERFDAHTQIAKFLLGGPDL